VAKAEAKESNAVVKADAKEAAVAPMRKPIASAKADAKASKARPITRQARRRPGRRGKVESTASNPPPCTQEQKTASAVPCFAPCMRCPPASGRHVKAGKETKNNAFRLQKFAFQAGATIN
jgi:hypothetical protein